jgi:50S ribosomal protein L16 3-hydroxylase
VSETPLGGQSPDTFLRRHWQRHPLLVRGAFAQFEDLVDLNTLFALAARGDCESRLVLRTGSAWQVVHGPLPRSKLRSLPARGWTLLVQGVNHFVPEVQKLLERFSFVPYARLDDVMVSFAPPGGGVGPHFDSYDVFLLQGTGRRRWQVSKQSDLALRENQPLKVLRRFKAQGECVLQAGDMLYLPPGWAHDGVALEPCLTYSIGFRAPSQRELISGFLAYLDETTTVAGCYSDRGQRRCRHPGRIEPRMVRYAGQTLDSIRWSRRDVIDFLGRHLSEPKSHVVFARPAPRPFRDFVASSKRHGLQLSAASRLLYLDACAWLNGETVNLAGELAAAAVRLADRRCLRSSEIPSGQAPLRVLYRWYRDGYIRIGHT